MAGTATSILFLVTLTLLALTLTLTDACRFRGYVCLPNQRERCRGTCQVTRGGCKCIASYSNYGYYPSYRSYRRRYYSPQAVRNARRSWGDRHPFYERPESPYSESRMEQSTNMMVELTRMLKMMP